MASWPLAAAGNWLLCANSSAVPPLASPQLPKWMAEMAKTPDKPRLMSQSPAASSCVPRVGGHREYSWRAYAAAVSSSRRTTSPGTLSSLTGDGGKIAANTTDSNQRRRLGTSGVFIPACLATEKYDVSAVHWTLSCAISSIFPALNRGWRLSHLAIPCLPGAESSSMPHGERVLPRGICLKLQTRVQLQKSA